MTDKELMTIPYIVYESTLEKEDRQHKRLVVIIVILIALLFVSNAMWIYFWNTYDYVDDEVMVNAEDDGTANYIGNNGDINNGVCLPTQAEQNTQ